MPLPLLLFHDGDTLVYINPVPETRRTLLAKPVVPHRVHSDKLLATGSTYFESLFSPQKQARVHKQRQMVGKLPEGVKYVIDLTPPMVDEEAIISMTEVSCPMGIRTWATLKDAWDLPAQCVGGEDELPILEEILAPLDVPESCVDGSSNPETPMLDVIDLTIEHSSDIGKDGGAYNQNEEMPLQLHTKHGLPVEYSAKRHRDGIEMVLRVLEGLGISLDTPCKLWTFFAVAKIFDVAAVLAVSDLISSWFYMSTNSRFVEIHPEITYQAACGIRSHDLCRSAFTVLVGDEALLYLLRSGNLSPLKSCEGKLARRHISENLDDNEVQRIKYASKSFADDLVNHFLRLVGGDMPWLEEIEEFRKLTRHYEEGTADRDRALELKQLLRNFVRFKIYLALRKTRNPRRSFDATPDPKSDQRHSPEFRDRDSLQRIICKGFWTELLTLDLNSFYVPDFQYHDSIADMGRNLLASRGEASAQIFCPSQYWLFQNVQWLNESVTVQASQSTSVQAPCLNLAGNSASNPTPGISTSTDANITLPFRSARTDTNNDANADVNTSSSKLSITTSENPEERKFDRGMFFSQVCEYVGSYARKLLYPDVGCAIPFDGTDTLTCLGDNRYRFLPLWAGGNDDGTGGAFADQDIPNMDNGGFSEPGPALPTGSTVPTSDSFSGIDPDDSYSTIHGASHHATYSHVSDLMSLDPSDVAPVERSAESQHRQEIEDDFIWDEQSDGESTVVMGSPSLPDLDFGDSDDDMGDADSESELVDGSD